MGAPDPLDTLAARKAGRPKSTGSLQPIPGRCGAQLTFTGTGPENPPRYCRLRPHPGRRRCKLLHNGDAATGVDAPGFKNGNASKWALLSPKVLAQFEATLADEQLLDLKPDVALLDVLTWDAAALLGDGGSAAQWKAAQEAFLQLKAAKTKAQVSLAVEKLGVVLKGGADASGAREETSKLAERRAKVVKTYRQLQVEAGDMIPAKRVAVVLGIFAALMREFITDDEQRREFGRRFTGALGQRLRAPDGAVVDARTLPE